MRRSIFYAWACKTSGCNRMTVGRHSLKPTCLWPWEPSLLARPARDPSAGHCGEGCRKLAGAERDSAPGARVATALAVVLCRDTRRLLAGGERAPLLERRRQRPGQAPALDRALQLGAGYAHGVVAQADDQEAVALPNPIAVLQYGCALGRKHLG